MFTRSLAATLMLLVLGVCAHAQEEKPADGDKEKEATRSLLLKAEDEYRSFFKRPETPYEYWAAMKFEVDVGKFDLAALHLKLLLQKEPKEEVDAALAKIEALEGMSSFLRLLTVKKWSDFEPFHKEAVKNVETLLDRVTAAVERALSDPERFKKFIPRLDAPTAEEREYAFVQIDRSKARAGPYLVDALRDNVGKPLFQKVIDVMVRLHPDSVPGWIDALKAASPADAGNEDLRLALLEVIDRRGDKRAIPYLWHLAAAPPYPAVVNAKARLVLGRLLSMDPQRLPPSHIALTELAEQYYQHKIRFGPAKVQVWPWDGVRIATKPVELTPRQAEEYFGLRAAREALDLAPSYLPAQNVFLSLTLDRAYGSTLDQAILQPMPAKLHQLVSSIDANLLLRVLDRALDEGNVPVIVAATQALGERGELRAARTTATGLPQGIVRGLYFSDRRVQYVAARALLGIPGPQTPVAADRIVAIFARLLAAGSQSRVLMIAAPSAQQADYRKNLQATGYEPVLVNNIREAFERLKLSSDYELIVLHERVGKELAFALAQLRSDVDQARTPILVLASKQNQLPLERLAERYAHVKVIPESYMAIADELKTTIDETIAAVSGAQLTSAERNQLRRAALDALWRMARNEIPGYDVRPALDEVYVALQNPETATEALEILSRISGPEPQTRLAAVVLDPNQAKTRIPAAIELNRHIQKYGLLLNRTTITHLKQAYVAAKEPELKSQLALVMGALGPSAQLTGTRLSEFRPDPPAPPPAQKDEKKEEQKEAK